MPEAVYRRLEAGGIPRSRVQRALRDEPELATLLLPPHREDLLDAWWVTVRALMADETDPTP